MSVQEPVIGLIGGSGIYNMEGLQNTRWKALSSPFGDPSDQLLFGELSGVKLVFLPRHGRGHCHAPTDINYRANIDILKRAGVTDIISLGACGSFREDLPPGTFVLVDQYIDRTYARKSSFFGKGMVAHVSMAEPVCARLGNHLLAAARQAGINIVRGGTYLAMEGPQFSTLAESELFRSWGCDVIGMTNMPEAKLAREAEICYASIAMVTDYDCWHPDHAHVQVGDILKVLTANVNAARTLVDKVIPLAGTGERRACPHGCDRVLDMALVTAPEMRDSKQVARLDAVAGRVLK